MQLPTAKTPVSKCNALGLYASAMLAKFPDNSVLAALSTQLAAATSVLAASQTAYAGAVIALIPKRVAVRFADHVSDRVVRDVQRGAEAADGRKNGRIAGAVFPGGVTPIVRPVGKTQVDEMRSLEGRLEAAIPGWPGAAAAKASVMAEREAYETALTERGAGMAHAADLRAKRDAAREDFLDVYASATARVKAEYPRDRPMQDLFFDKVTQAVVPDDAEADDDDSPPPIPS